MINERHLGRVRRIGVDRSSAREAMMGNALINALIAAGVVFAIGYGWIAHLQNRGQRRSRAGAGSDGGSDDPVICIGHADAMRSVEGGEQQAVDRHGEAGEELRDIGVVRSLDDQSMPGGVEPREAIVVGRSFVLVHLCLQRQQALLARRIVRSGKFRGREAFQDHAGTVDLAHFVGTEALDRSAAELLDGNQTLGLQSPQCFTHPAAAGAGIADDVRLDQALTRHELAQADAIAHPVGHLLCAHAIDFGNGLRPGSRLSWC